MQLQGLQKGVDQNPAPWLSAVCHEFLTLCHQLFLYRPQPKSLFHFFFSSRRRHTRSLCDWSSDVCSSDLVLDSPYFTITDAAGHYRLTNLPAGHFVVKAWVDSKTTRERPVDLNSGAVL